MRWPDGPVEDRIYDYETEAVARLRSRPARRRAKRVWLKRLALHAGFALALAFLIVVLIIDTQVPLR